MININNKFKCFRILSPSVWNAENNKYFIYGIGRYPTFNAYKFMYQPKHASITIYRIILN